MEEPKQNLTPIQSSNPQPSSGKSVWSYLRRYQLYAIAVLVIIIVAGGWFTYHHYHHKPIPTASNSTPAITYSTLDRYVVGGTHKSAGMAFAKPTQISAVVYKSAGQVALVDVNSNNTVNSYIAAASTFTSKPYYTPSQFANLSAIILAPKSSEYTKITSPIDSFVKSRVLPNTTVTFSNASLYNNGNIKNDFWKINFTGSSSQNNTKQISGTVLFTATNNALYYFMVYATTSIWQANQNVLYQSLTSLELDI